MEVEGVKTFVTSSDSSNVSREFVWFLDLLLTKGPICDLQLFCQVYRPKYFPSQGVVSLAGVQWHRVYYISFQHIVRCMISVHYKG